MKTKIKSIIMGCGMLLLCAGFSNAQGLYGNPESGNGANATESSSVAGSSFFNDAPMLKAKPDGQVPEPGTAPVSDGLWVILSIGVLYGVKLYYSKKRAEEVK